MNDKKIIKIKTEYIKKCLKDAKKFSNFSDQDFENNYIIKGYIERQVFLIGQFCNDVVNYIFELLKCRKSNNKLLTLKKDKIINQKDFKILTELIKIKDILMHETNMIDYKILCNILYYRQYDINKFIQIIEKY